LTGARLVVTSELTGGRSLNESMVKDLTGGDSITARFLHQEFFTFTPIFKIYMYAIWPKSTASGRNSTPIYGG
jgi:putative DNA primase/helicase